MTYAIETFVGRKFGGWSRGDDRYPSYSIAEAIAANHTLSEHQAKATQMTRRVVAVQS